jgi:hypothetical protein
VIDRSIGARYAINPNYRLTFERPRAGVSGSRDLKWSIGSGAVGRSYVFAEDGFLFQAPVSYYSLVRKWDLSPGFAGKPAIDLAKPIEEPCLQCHATGVRLLENTQNRYADPPFFEQGVGCERCHGPGRAHVQAVATRGRDLAIVNPAKLDGEQRDSICLQCHLTGAARVTSAGKPPFSYRPGERLSDYISVFVWSSADDNERAAATDHAEQLARSKCRQASGERLWCGTCHNPHSTNVAAQRAASFRSSCLTCHDTSDCKERPALRQARQDQCHSCHMPRRQSREGDHVAFTLHSIPRTTPAVSAKRADRELRSFFNRKPPDRDLALAYAAAALADASLRKRAAAMLDRVPAPDATVLVQRAQLYDFEGRATEAERLYRQVLAADPMNPTALANLAIYLARIGASDEAIRMWADVFARYPHLPGPGMNLAIAQQQAGQHKAAATTLARILRFHPDMAAAKEMLIQVRTFVRD